MSITRVGIVGSGIMGAGIAEVAAANGHEVVLRSRSTAGADAMAAGLARSLAKQVEKGKRTEEEAAGRRQPPVRVEPVRELVGMLKEYVGQAVVPSIESLQDIIKTLLHFFVREIQDSL